MRHVCGTMWYDPEAMRNNGGMPFPGGRVHIGVMPMNKGNPMSNNGGMDDIFKMFFGMGEAMDDSLNGMPMRKKRKPSPIIKEITINGNGNQTRSFQFIWQLTCALR